MVFRGFFPQVLSKLPAVVDTGNDITASHSGDVSTTSVISSGIIQEFDNAGSIDWSQSSRVTEQKTESFDWSTPVSAPVEDELVLTFDDDDDDDKDDDGDTDEEVDPDDVKEKDGDVSSDGNKTLIDGDQVCEFFYLYCNSP